MTQLGQPSLEKFTEQDENGAIYTVSLEIALYANKPVAELARGAIACYEFFVEKFGASVNWYLASSMRRVRRFSGKYVEVFPTLCKESESCFERYRLFSGKGFEDYLPPVFATGGYRTFSWLQIQLSPILANNWEELLTLLVGLAAPFPFRAGHVGYALCWNDLSPDREHQVSQLNGPLLKRYPGFSPGVPQDLCDQDLPPVNWLTLIGPELLGKLGGIAGVRQAFSDQAISVMPLGHGAFIRAGELPQLGDLNRRDDLPLYRKVGSYLKDHRGHRKIRLTGLKDDSEAWLARFDS